jgi:hypothetical protein
VSYCNIHKEPIYTVFGPFLKEEIIYRSGSNSFWIVSSHDFLEAESAPTKSPFYSLWNKTAQIADIDADVPTDSGSSFIDNDCSFSQPPVSEEFEPFPDGLPPHAVDIAAKCALMQEDERALAEPPKAPRCAFIDDKAEFDHRNFDVEQLAVQMPWPRLEANTDVVDSALVPHECKEAKQESKESKQGKKGKGKIKKNSKNTISIAAYFKVQKKSESSKSVSVLRVQ